MSLPIRQRYEFILDRIAKTSISAGRKLEDVKLVVVTKGHPIEEVKEVIQAGARRLGENYIEEAIPKIVNFKEIPELEWHMIGHLQSRKYKILSENFSMLHSLDSLKLAKKISLYNSEIGRTTPVLLECNVSGEVSKFGWSIRGEHSLEVVINEFRELSGLKGIKVYGLMCMTPYSNNPEESRPYFKSMKQFLEILKKEISTIEWQELSMGMSGEYEIAIQEGATIVRIGTSIMGPRQ